MTSWVESSEQMDVGFVLSTIPEGPIKIQMEQKKRSTGGEASVGKTGA